MSELVLFDTNILVYAHNQSSLFHHQALELTQMVKEGKIKAVLSQQNLIEFYAIVTDKRRVTKPLIPKVALGLIDSYLNSPFEIIFPSQQTTDILTTLCKKKSIKGGSIFDIYLIATMLTNDIKSIVTVNTKDFKDFTEVQVISLAKANES